MKSKEEHERFWHIRSAHYDKLFWVKDKSYLQAILDLSELKKNHLILDVGTGTGAVANAVRKAVEHVVAIDISHSMMEKGRWEGVSIIKWDIGESLFSDGIFDRVMARMVFHHILDNLDRAVLRCYDVLKKGGKIIVAEGIPPSEDPEVINWYTQMFKLKEKRRTFTARELKFYLKKNGFRNVKAHAHLIKDFNINNWLENSGLPKINQKRILDLHLNADPKIKDVYNMRMVKGECIVQTLNVIVVGQK